MAQIALNYYLLEGNGGTVALPFLALLSAQYIYFSYELDIFATPHFYQCRVHSCNLGPVRQD